MSDTPNVMLPFILFNASPDNLHEIMTEKGCHTMRNYAVMHAIISFVQLEITEHVHGFDFPIGKTISISYSGIALRAGCDRRTAIRAINELSSNEVGLLVKEVSPVSGMHHESNSYQIVFYTEAIDKIKKDPGLIQRKQKFLALASTQAAESARHQDAETLPDDLKSPSNPEPNATKSPFLDLKKEEAPIPTGLGTSTGIAPTVPKGERRGDFSNSQRQEKFKTSETAQYDFLPAAAPGPGPEKNLAKEKDVSSLSENSSGSETQPAREPVKTPSRQQQKQLPARNSNSGNSSAKEVQESDVVPNGYIGQAIDQLMPGVQMNRDKDASESSQGPLDEYILALNPDTPVISTWKYHDVAVRLQNRIETALEQANISIPPMRFFKEYCIKEMEHRIAQGELDTRPTSLNFFLSAHTGKAIVDLCLERLSLSNKAAINKEKTQAFLDEQKAARQSRPREIPAEAKAELDRLLGRV